MVIEAGSNSNSATLAVVQSHCVPQAALDEDLSMSYYAACVQSCGKAMYLPGLHAGTPSADHHGKEQQQAVHQSS
jgi:hypothetical protein